ncbi:MAG: hypothetical protein AB7W16_11605 [Candidatus Obscuribacterales bacterium]
MAQSLESFSLTPQAVDSSAPFRAEYLDSTIGKKSVSDTTVAAPDSPPPPAGVKPEAWSQISSMIGAGQEVNFTTAASGQVPDYVLGADGNLVKNPAKTTPNPDGSVTVQVDSPQGEAAAKKAIQQLEVAKVQEKIYFWQKAHPGSTDVPEFLKGMLATAQSNAAIEPAVNQSTRQPETVVNQSQPVDTAPQQVAAPAQPFSYGGANSQSIGNRNIGTAPESGYRNGSFEPNGPIDRSAIPKPVEGDVAIKGPPSCNAEQIQTFLEKMGSPAAKEAGFSQALYDACTERGIDPAVAVGFFLQESTCGRYGRAHNNLSIGNIKGRAPESGGTDGTFRRYNSWAEGARDWARLIDESYVQKRGLTSLSQVIDVYAPSSDGNNTVAYVNTVNGVVQNFKNMNNGNAVA